MIDINELRKLTQAVSEWGCCNQAWHDASEVVLAAVVGHIDEDGNTYPVATIDCDQYHAAHQSLPLAKFYAAANPAAITELLDRLEAAESEAIEQARLNGMGAERELALMAKLEAAEKAVTEAYQRGYATGQEEIERLRAKIEEMEKQEPVAWVVPPSRRPHWGEHAMQDAAWEARQCGGTAKAEPLYALPGAKGEEK